MASKCTDCGRPKGDDLKNPVKGHCYAAWFIDWQSTDCWQISSEPYKRSSAKEMPDG